MSENCTVQNCYQCLTNVFLNTSIRLNDCENEKRRLEAQVQSEKAVAIQKERELQEQHAKEMIEKDSVIQELESKLVASEEESARKIQELQEQHGEKLSKKDLEIQQLEIKLAVAKKEITDRTQEVQEQLEKMSVTPQSNEPTQFHIDLGKLYMALQEAKKPQEALIAAKDKEIENLIEQHEEKLTAKDQEITNIREQHISKIVARDSEIQRLTEKVKNVDERNENQRKSICHFRQKMLTKDQEVGALKKRVADLEAELGDGRDV